MKNFEPKLREALSTLNITDTEFGTSTGRNWLENTGETTFEIYSPADGVHIGNVHSASTKGYGEVMKKAEEAFRFWRLQPAPQRGEIVRQIGNKLRKYKEPLGTLVSYEMGKIYEEGLGEVQEMIDICDFAVGLSRQLYGKTMHSERPAHRMYEQWHPLGVVGIISAFNFPVAVYSWNAFLAAVCGDVVVWKPSEKVPFCAIAVQKIIAEVLEENDLPEGIFNLVIGDYTIGQKMAEDERIPLVSATGSVAMGKKVAPVVAARLGRSLLELGGNNAIIISEHADLDLAIRGVVFGAAGTAGQRCTSTRRLIVHDSKYDEVKERLVNAYKQLSIGHPLDIDTLVGPLIDEEAVKMFYDAIERVKESGGTILTGGERLQEEGLNAGHYVQPAIAEVPSDLDLLNTETFAPLLYLMKYSDFEKAIDIQNNVPQGLSSALFTLNLREAERFLAANGSDCGIANINIGTSGAEIGGAFGGEKETGGGREAGSDSWKSYMRRQTNTINYSTELPLAQGIEFVI